MSLQTVLHSTVQTDEVLNRSCFALESSLKQTLLHLHQCTQQWTRHKELFQQLHAHDKDLAFILGNSSHSDGVEKYVNSVMSLHDIVHVMSRVLYTMQSQRKIDSEERRDNVEQSLVSFMEHTNPLRRSKRLRKAHTDSVDKCVLCDETTLRRIVVQSSTSCLCPPTKCTCSGLRADTSDPVIICKTCYAKSMICSLNVGSLTAASRCPLCRGYVCVEDVRLL